MPVRTMLLRCVVACVVCTCLLYATAAQVPPRITVSVTPTTYTVEGQTSTYTVVVSPNILSSPQVTVKPDLVETPAPSPTSPSVVAEGVGPLSGTYYWVVTYVTDKGETAPGYGWTATLASQAARLSGIPTGPPEVVGRKIYRTKAGTYYPHYYVGTIQDNTTTTYLDNTADTALGVACDVAGTASAHLTVNGSPAMVLSPNLVSLGRGNGTAPQVEENVWLGNGIASNLTTAHDDAVVGSGGAGTSITSASGETYVGAGAGHSHQSGNQNAWVGLNAGWSNQDGAYNTGLGAWAGFAGQHNKGCTFLGYEAGQDESGDSKLAINVAGADGTPQTLISGQGGTTPTVTIQGTLQASNLSGISTGTNNSDPGHIYMVTPCEAMDLMQAHGGVALASVRREPLPGETELAITAPIMRYYSDQAFTPVGFQVSLRLVDGLLVLLQFEDANFTLAKAQFPGLVSDYKSSAGSWLLLAYNATKGYFEEILRSPTIESDPRLPAPGTAGNVLTSNGTGWVSAAPPAGGGTDTLATVTARGATTSVASSFTGGLTASSVSTGCQTIQTTGPSMVGATIKGYSGQTADLLQVQDSTGTVRAKFDNNANLTVGTGSSIGALTFSGTGLNDATLGGTYTGAFNQTLRIKISAVGNPDKFDWSIDGGTTWVGTGISITSAPTTLSGTGVTVTFGATTGHTLGDYWQATLNAPVGSSSASNSLNIGANPVVRAFGTANTAIGVGVMGGGKNTGTNNTASGAYALYSNTTGYSNVANGYQTLYSNTTGSANVANGLQALYSNTTGSDNVADGLYALYSNTTGSNNVANGYQALYSNTTGNSNVANGMYALSYNTTGGNNVANGMYALFNNTTASGNVANGYQALYKNTTGNGNVANGAYALYNNTIGSGNTANGTYALQNTTTGTNNVANGYSALRGNTTGNDNVVDGAYTLFNNTTGSDNIANGYSALYSNTTGSQNIASGTYALYYNTTGNNNVVSGYQALYDLGSYQTAGSFNVGTSYTIRTVGTTDFTQIGASSNIVGTVFTATGPGTGTGTATPNNTNNNTAVGYNTGRGIVYGTGNTILGANVTGLAAGLTNNIILANGTGAIKAQHDGTNWTLTGGVTTTGSVTATQYRLSALNTAPASATDTGTTGEIRITNNYIYVCVATNTWVRAALTSW